VSPCARCGFALSPSATKCLFCGHIVGAALPPEGSRPREVAGAADPASAPPGAAPSGGGRIPRLTVPYRRPADFDVAAASNPPTSPLSRPGFGAEIPGTAAPAPANAAAVAARPPTHPPRRISMVTSLVIAALVGALAGGAAFLIFIALRG